MDKKLEIIDTNDKFSLKIDGKEIPYITEYSITVKADSGFVDLDIRTSIPKDADFVIGSKIL